MSRNPPMPASIMARRTGSVGATVLVIQAKPSYIHQMMRISSRTRAAQAQVRLTASTVVSCVMVKTKTRSKKSSKVDTRTPGSGSLSVIAGAEAGHDLMQLVRFDEHLAG